MTDWLPYSIMPPSNVALEISTPNGIRKVMQQGVFATLYDLSTGEKVTEPILGWKRTDND